MLADKYEITYKKANGELIKRIRNTVPVGIGKETSMGWKVVDIKHVYNNKIYESHDYYKMKDKIHNKLKRKQNFKSFFKNDILKYIIYFLYIPFFYLYFIK